MKCSKCGKESKRFRVILEKLICWKCEQEAKKKPRKAA